MTDQLVKDNERIDDLQNGYYVIQDPDKFCFGRCSSSFRLCKSKKG